MRYASEMITDGVMVEYADIMNLPTCCKNDGRKAERLATRDS